MKTIAIYSKGNCIEILYVVYKEEENDEGNRFYCEIRTAWI